MINPSCSTCPGSDTCANDPINDITPQTVGAIIAGSTKTKLASKRAGVMVEFLCYGMHGGEMTPEDLLLKGDDSGRVVHMARSVAAVPIVTHKPKSKHTSYSIHPIERERFLNPKLRSQQVSEQRVLMVAHVKRKQARNFRSYLKKNGRVVPDWLDQAADKQLPAITLGVAANDH